MNDEIKEILDFKENADYKKLSCDEIAILKDYITNLQQQLHQASLDIQELTERDIECPSWCDKLTNLQQEIKEANDSITWWTNRFKAVERDNRELQRRIAGLEAENETLRSDFKNQVEYTNKIAEENERLKETNVYCNRTDCIGRIKDSRKYDSVYQEKEDYKSRCEKASEKLSFIDETLENDTLNVPLCITKINSALNILQGENNDN